MKDALVIAALSLVAIVIGAYLLFSHAGASWPQGGSAGVAAVSVPFTELTAGTHSTVARRVNYLITSEGELARLWAMLQATGTPPAVDFTKDAVIAVFAGERPTTGYAISVTKVEDTGAARMVTVQLTKPGPDCLEGQLVTSPFEVLTLPASTLPLAHEDTVATTSCGK